VFARGGDTARLRALGFEVAIRLCSGVERAIRHLGATARR
jgi:hypothetical protein